MSLRQRFSYILKYLIVITAFGGTIYGLITYQRDGYSVWHKRLMYYTTQSNLWIGLIYLIIIILSFCNNDKSSKAIKTIYYCKYIFVTAIAMTGIIFCGLLGPFADESYHPWSFYSLLVHAVTPVLAVIEFYLDKYKYDFKISHIWATSIPPVVYYSLTIFLCAFKFDFGRGEPYPYFFLDLYSELGLFGFSNGVFYKMGTVWWIILFSALYLLIALLLMKTHHSTKTKKRPD